MSLLNAFKPRPAPVRRPGKHTAEWAEMRRDLAAARALCGTLEAARETAARRHETEMHQQAAAFRVERDGLQEAVRLAADDNAELRAERDEARGRHDEVLGRLRVAEAQAEQLRATLRALEVPPGPDAAPGQPALMNDPGAWINQPDGPPRPDEWISPVAPAAPIESEAADVNAETQAVDVAALRDAEATQQLDATALRNAAGLGATAVLPVVAVPPSADAGAAAVMPLYSRSLPVCTVKPTPPTEVSRGAAEAAQASVADALEPAPDLLANH